MYVAATMVGPVFHVALRYPVGGGLNDGFQGLLGTGLGRAQPRFELAEGSFNGIKVRRVRRQVAQARPVFLHGFVQLIPFIPRQIVEHHYVARPQGGAGHLVEVGGKHVAADGPVHSRGVPPPATRPCAATTGRRPPPRPRRFRPAWHPIARAGRPAGAGRPPRPGAGPGWDGGAVRPPNRLCVGDAKSCW